MPLGRDSSFFLAVSTREDGLNYISSPVSEVDETRASPFRFSRRPTMYVCQQEKLIRRLDQEFLACARRYGLPLGDFPKVRPAGV